jgi:hypothetical protein
LLARLVGRGEGRARCLNALSFPGGHGVDLRMGIGDSEAVGTACRRTTARPLVWTMSSGFAGALFVKCMTKRMSQSSADALRI